MDTPEIARVRALVDRLYTAVRAVLLYPAASPLPAGFRHAFHEDLTAYLAEHESLALTVRDDELLFAGKPVHKDAGGEIDLTGPFGRDGIEGLTFLRGVSTEELEKLFALIKRAVKERNPDEDMVTLFWEASFRKVRYRVVEGLKERAAAPPPRRTKIKSAGQASAAGGPGAGAPAGTGAGSGAAGGAGEGAGGEKPGTAAAETAKTSGIARILNQLSDFTADAGLREALRRESEAFDPVAAVVGIALEILDAEDDPEGLPDTCAMLDSLYERVIERADFASALRLHGALREAEKASSGPRAERLAASRARATDGVRMGKLVAALNANESADLDGARRLLLELPDGAVTSLAAALGDVEHVPARKVACDVLAERGAARLDDIGALTRDPRWFVVRNAAQVLSRIGGPAAMAHLERAAAHPDPKVRRAVLDGAARILTPEAGRLLRGALADSSVELQIRALRALAARRDEETGALAETRVRGADFRRSPPDQQQEWLSALARIRGDAALPAFQPLLARRRFFDGGARRFLRQLAIAALGDGGGPEATALLERYALDADERVRAAATLALERARRARQGER